jgi:hypothetical protein
MRARRHRPSSIAAVPFHVQIQRGFRVARAFNLSEQELHVRVLGPWRAGAPLSLGDRDWDPAEAELTILEGPELDPPQLAVGQGWSNAERSAQDATARLLAGPPPLPAGVAVLAQSDEAARAAADALAAVGVQPLAWDPARPASTALVAFDAAAGAGDARWWLEVGRALGALGGRALLATRGADALPAPLHDARPLRLDALEPQALPERLRLAGRQD